MRVELTAKAQNDLRDIALFIAADSPSNAMSFYEELELACLELGSFPKRNPVISKSQTSEIRRHVHKNYVILYQLDAHCVFVLRVLNSAMNIEALLSEPNIHL